MPDWLTFLFATAKIGVVTVTVNTAYRLHELEYLVKQSDIKALCLIDGFRDSDYVAMVNELVPELKSCERGQLASARFPRLKNVIFIGPEKHRGMYNTPGAPAPGQPHAATRSSRAHRRGLDCHDVINMQYTSGTTGFPKGVMLTHHNILNNGFHIGERQKFTEAERVCLPVPLFHCFGLVLGIMAIVTHGATRGDRRELRPAARPGLGAEGDVHGPLRRARPCSSPSSTTHVRDVRPLAACAPASWRARPARWRS